MNRFLLIILAALFAFQVKAQTEEKKESGDLVPFFGAAYSYQIPGGDIAKRFGNNSTIGGTFSVKTPTNWIFGIDGNMLFGSDLKETTTFQHILTSDGNLINTYGDLGTYLTTERGMNFGLKVGKIIPVFNPNKNSGILISSTIGFLQYRTRIEVDGNNIPQILEDYKKGYDKLTNGFSVSEFIGYMYIGDNQLANFYVGVEFQQAWTQNRREVNFDTMQKDETKFHDYLYSLKAGWIIPLYKRTQDKYYYF